MINSSTNYWHYSEYSTSQCRDVEFVYVRGSGEEHESGVMWTQFSVTAKYVAHRLKMSYRLIDLDYPAVAITSSNMLGAYFSSGRAFEFGRSVDKGVDSLLTYYNYVSNRCRYTYWVFMGYSQGAKVLANSAPGFDQDNVVYIMMLGDPNTNLPEGDGLFPPACYGGKLSSYRVYAPDCGTSSGVFGKRNPYEIWHLAGRYGLWCNIDDFICGSSKNPFRNKGHETYASEGLVQMAVMRSWRELWNLRVRGSLRSSLSDNRIRDGGLDLQYSSRADAPYLAQLTDDEEDDPWYSQYLVVSPTSYNAHSGDTLHFDASNSANLLGEDYEIMWQVTDRRDMVFYGEQVDITFPYQGVYLIWITMTSSSGIVTESSVSVYVQDDIDEIIESIETLDVPVVETLKQDESSLRITWHDAPEEAAYLGVFVNGVYMGQAPASQNEFVMTDMDFSLVKVELAWLNEEMEMQERGLVFEEEHTEEDMVSTGVDRGFFAGVLANLGFGSDSSDGFGGSGGSGGSNSGGFFARIALLVFFVLGAFGLRKLKKRPSDR